MRRRAPLWMLIASLVGFAAYGIAGAQPPGNVNPPAPDAGSPTATAHQAAPEAKQVPGAKPVSGGGDAPHGAMQMNGQIAALTPLVKHAPDSVPAGIDPAYWKALVPADNAMNEARVALGKKLYFDVRLSKDGTVACATCHDISRGLTDRRGTSEGIGDKLGQRNAPTTMNALFFSSQFWDGRANTLEDQAKLPIVNPIEMGMPDEKTALAAIAGDPEYQKMFQAAYGKAPSFDDLARAIAAFERTLVFLDSPFDRFLAGDLKAIDDDAKAGWVLFNGKGRCMSCHHMSSSSPVGTDNRFHNVGVSARKTNFEQLAKKALEVLAKDSSKDAIDRIALQTDLSDLGRFVVTRNRADIGAFKTQQMRNVGLTAPYMHDGTLATLWDVMDHYDKGGEPNAFLDGGIEPLALTDREIDQMVAFMFALTDLRFAADNKAELERQRAIAKQRRPFKDEDAAHRRVLPFEKRAAGRR